MLRRMTAIILIGIAICLLISVPVLAFTPLGVNLLGTGQPAPPPTFAPTFLTFTPIPTPKATPVLTPNGKPPTISANEAMLVDEDSGHILFDLNGEHAQPMASTTKIITAVIAIQTANLDVLVTVHQDAVNEVNNNGGSRRKFKGGGELERGDRWVGLCCVL